MIAIRDFEAADAAAVNRVVLAAWAEFEGVFSGFAGLALRLGAAAALAGEVELIVAAVNGAVAGAVGYVPPHGRREPMFPPEWALVRLLSVAPSAHGLGIGRRLSEECIARARRDGALAVGLHTSPAMRVALPMYLRLGFEFDREIPARHGVPYALYELTLG